MAAPLRFLGRDEWFALIPLQVLVQRVDLHKPSEDEPYPSEAEGSFIMEVSGPQGGRITVGDWVCPLCGEAGGPLEKRLSEFYAKHCPDKIERAAILAEEFGAGREGDLNVLLKQTYGADLTSQPGGWIKALVRRIAPLTFVIEDAPGVEGNYAITFPGPLGKRTKFLDAFEQNVGRLAIWRNEVPQASLDDCIRDPTKEIASPLGIVANYMETMVPEKAGPLKHDDDGKSYYGTKIRAGGFRIAQGLRSGSVWLSDKMVSGTQAFSEWAGPAKSEAVIHPSVDKGLTYTADGTGKVLNFARDALGGLAAVAARGVSYVGEKISETESYKEWEKKPLGPRTKAAKEVAGSVIEAAFTIGYGLRDATHTVLDHGLKPSIIHASHARWGAEAGSAADRACQSVLNLHYAALAGGKFIERGAAEVVGSLGKMALMDATSKTLFLEDMKNGKVYCEGGLLMNELQGFGGRTEIWTCFICVLRDQSLSLYTPILEEGVGRTANAGIKLVEAGEEKNKIVEAIEEGSGAAKSSQIEVGDLLMAVNGISVQTMSVQDVEAMLLGAEGTIVRLMIMSGAEMKDYADAVAAVEAPTDEEDVENDYSLIAKDEVNRSLLPTPPQMKQVAVERFSGIMAETFEQAVISQASPESEQVTSPSSVSTLALPVHRSLAFDGWPMSPGSKIR